MPSATGSVACVSARGVSGRTPGLTNWEAAGSNPAGRTRVLAVLALTAAFIVLGLAALPAM